MPNSASMCIKDRDSVPANAVCEEETAENVQFIREDELKLKKRLKEAEPLFEAALEQVRKTLYLNREKIAESENKERIYVAASKFEQDFTAALVNLRELNKALQKADELDEIIRSFEEFGGKSDSAKKAKKGFWSKLRSGKSK